MQSKGVGGLNDDLGRDFLLKGFPNPEREGCPDENTLRAFAEGRLPEDHPARLHLGSCSECYAEYLHYREDFAGLQSQRILPTVPASARGPSRIGPVLVPAKSNSNCLLPLAIAASFVFACVGGVVAFRHQHAASNPTFQVASREPVDASVDLFNSGTLRGASEDAAPLQQVALQAAVVRMSIVLPRFSDVGPYSVVVSRDKAGSQVVGRATGEALQRNRKVVVQVTLDLRDVKPGSYFLATVRGADNGTYYYPLKIK